jgi:hypothetical protein
VFQRPPKDGSRMALRGRRCSSPRPGGELNPKRTVPRIARRNRCIVAFAKGEP